jgi:RHS repeat-associated protein
LELDENAQIISYEEYYPYGDTSYQAGNSTAEVSQKRYRYTGKEKDEESGLYYHGARYYACWLGRWTAADPAGLVDGVNLYVYCKGSPIAFVDPDGMKIIAQNPRDQQLYAQWTKTLKPEQAQIVSKLEKSDVVFNWQIVDQPIPVKVESVLNWETGKAEVHVKSAASGVLTPSGDGSKREFDVKIYDRGIKSVKGIRSDALHELVGHGKQANDYLQKNMSRTGNDWGQEYVGDKIKYEREAFKAQGTPKTDEELQELYGR